MLQQLWARVSAQYRSATIEIFARLQQEVLDVILISRSTTIEIFARLQKTCLLILNLKSKISLGNLYYDCLHAI